MDAHTKDIAAARPSAWGVASLALAMLMASLDTSIANIALPTLAQAFGARFSQVQWVVLAYLLSVTIFIVAAGRLGDMVGRKPLLVAGIALFSASSMLCSLTPSLPVLIAGRGLQGIGAAIMLSLSMALVSEVVPTARIGRTMGLLGTMSALGTSLGPSVGGLLIESFGWRAIFLPNLPLGLVAIALAARTLPAARRALDTAP
ncbi:MAG: MFS transporter, partial [Sphingomonadaceae bacterium]|nr:MFS transporter [Sphingomonadaceae bacterium]